MRSWLKPCNVKTMTPTEAAWLAGFIDGEGTIGSWRGGRKKAHTTHCLSAANTVRESLEQCQMFTGVGTIRMVKRVRANHSQLYFWRVTSQRDIAEILRQMMPYLTIKKAKAVMFLSRWVDVLPVTGT